jgi:chromosomal replication initiator protein
MKTINRKVNPYAFAGMQFDTVGGVLNNPSKIPDTTTRNIIALAIEEITEVSIEDIKSRKRHRYIVEIRQIYHYFLKNYTGYNLTAIGALTNRDHSTVLYSIKMVEDLKETDPAFNALVNKIKKEIELKITEKLEILI